MKKLIEIINFVENVLNVKRDKIGLIGCRKEDGYNLRILVPAGSSESFVYSDEELSPIGNKITISAGEGLGDTEVILKPVNETLEPGYVAEYLTPGMPVEFDTSNVKDEWFKIGVSVQNDTNADITVYVEVEGVEVRIEENAEKSEQWDLIPMDNSCE